MGDVLKGGVMVSKTWRGLYALPRLVVGIIALIALGNGLVFAQGFTGAITGTVKDVSGAAIVGAAVTVKHVETGLTRAVQADASGNYNVSSLPVGEYELTAEKMGFQVEVRRGINLAVAQEAVVNVTLQVGSMVQQVTVTEDAPLVNTTMTQTSGLISEEQIKELPLNGRSFDQLLTLNAGTVDNRSNINNGAWTSFSVSGKRPETNRFIMNGVDYIGSNSTGQFITPSGSSGQLLGVEAVREYNVLQHTYGAEYGKRAGAQVTVVSSSGTNQWHGDAFEYLRNSALDARNFFDDTIGAPPFKRYQFGGALGGPLKKNKAFLFGTYEGFQERLSRSSASVVPGAFARRGLMPDGSPVSGLKPEMLKYANAFWPAPSTPDRSDGTAIAYSNPPQTIGENFGLARFDYVISSKDSFYANLTANNGLRINPWGGGGGGAPNFKSVSDIISQTLSLKETHVFSSSLVNIATLGYAGGYATLVNAPAVPMPADVAFLEGGNPGTIVIGGGVSAP